MGKSSQGARNVLMKRYELCRKDEGAQDEGEETPVEDGRTDTHASGSPMKLAR